MTRRMGGLVGLCLALLVAGTSATNAQEGQAEALQRLFADQQQDLLRLNPTIALYRGDRRYLGRFGDTVSQAYVDEVRQLNTSYGERLAAIDRSALSAADRLSYDVFAFRLEQQAAAIAVDADVVASYLYVQHLNAHYDFFAQLQSGGSAAPFRTVEDYEAGLERAEDFARVTDLAIARMTEGMANGYVHPRIVVERVIAGLMRFLATPVDDSLFYRPIRELPDALASERDRLDTAYRASIEQVIMPAYRRLLGFMAEQYLPRARDTVGYSALPDGAALYAQAARSYTTTGLSPKKIHELGLAEVARIKAEMEAIQTQVGFNGDLAGFIDMLRTDPRFYYDTAEAYLADYDAIRKRVDPQLGRLFGRLPAAPYEIKPFDPEVAPAQTTARYAPGTPDGSRPGIFYVNTYDLPSRPKYSMEVLLVHEAVPGHHLQIAIAQELDGLPDFRRFGRTTAFVEGWALYSERLGEDLGLYQDPYSAFGMLSFDMWRACRLVVDTGLHAFGWSRQRAIDYLLSHTALGETDAAVEVDRYIVWPGQALAYKVGQLKILELRARAEAALGDAFDIRAFHDELLADGALPLAILEAKMDRWIADQRAG